jgi:hypothetical protein
MATTAIAISAALRTTWPTPSGLADQAPKHAHGGRRPSARRSTMSAVKATNTPARQRRRRPAPAAPPGRHRARSPTTAAPTRRSVEHPALVPAAATPGRRRPSSHRRRETPGRAGSTPPARRPPSGQTVIVMRSRAANASTPSLAAHSITGARISSSSSSSCAGSWWNRASRFTPAVAASHTAYSGVQ